MDTQQFMEHVISMHGMGSRDPMGDAMGLSSPATRAYHRHLHEIKQDEQDHTHPKEDLWPGGL
jgi:hypothetical protein